MKHLKHFLEGITIAIGLLTIVAGGVGVVSVVGPWLEHTYGAFGIVVALIVLVIVCSGLIRVWLKVGDG